MYEYVTYEDILQRMLDRVPSNFDKREGSVIYDALAPAAIEMQNMYIELDNVLNEAFADTQSRPYLIRRCAERNIIPKSATYAIRRGEFNIDVPIGSRFSLNNLNYVVTQQIEDEEGVFELQCETVGKDGNVESGTLIPIDYIDGLQTATLTDVIIPGEDEEETEKLRERYFESYDSQSFGGNVASYKEKTKGIFKDGVGGVGGVKVKRAWNGGGTVKLVIVDSTFSKPSSNLVDLVQEEADPLGHQGEGLGYAPLDHVVTVVGCSTSSIDISTHITFKEGWKWESTKASIEEAIDGYFAELSSTWESTGNDGLIVRISQIEMRLLEVEGVADVESTALNGSAKNIALGVDAIPIRGNLTNV